MPNVGVSREDLPGRTARIGLTGANRTVPSSRKAAFLHEQIRAFETRRPLLGNQAESGMVELFAQGWPVACWIRQSPPKSAVFTVGGRTGGGQVG